MRLTIVAPTFNELENVDPLVEQVEKALDGTDYEVLIVDDDSPDLTWKRVEEIGPDHPRVRLLRRTHNRGLTPSVIDGFSHAETEAVCCIDADLQHDPGILNRMLEELASGADLVIGSRFVAGGGISNWSRMRRLESWTAAKLARIFLGTELHDPMSGYFMMRRSDFLAVRSQLEGKGFKVLLEIVAKTKPKNVREVGYVFRSRTAGKSKLSGRVVLLYLLQLWQLSVLGRFFPLRFAQFAIVGGIGVIVNLLALTAIVHWFGFRDWRASALASTVAIFNNYVLNNLWTFRDRIRVGFNFIRGYLTNFTASDAPISYLEGWAWRS